MKKLLSLSLALFLLISFALSARAEEDSVEVTVDGYSFRIPSWLADMCTLEEASSERGRFIYSCETSDLFFSFSTNDYEEDHLLEGSSFQARELFFSEYLSRIPSDDRFRYELIHREDVTVCWASYKLDSDPSWVHFVNAVSCPSAPPMYSFFYADTDNITDEALTEIAEMLKHTLTYSDFIPVDEPVQPNPSASSSINLDSLSTQELLALRVQIDQAIINRASLSD